MRLSILFLTVFVDLVGFGIVLPLLPLYADRFGASGTVVGVLVLSYSAAQLLFAPLWGRLSDRYGRRPVLIVGLLGSTLSYLVFAYADSVWVLLLSRVMAGIGGANIPVAQAYIADVTPPEHRAGNMGLIGAAFGLGFIFGPIIGGVLAPVSPALPGLAAAGLCGANALVAFFLLPESLTVRERVRQMRARRVVAGPVAAGKASGRTGRPEFRLVMANPAFVDTLILFFVFTLAFSILHPIFPLYASERFGFGERGVGWLFAFLGTISAVVQGAVVRILVARAGEVALIRASAVPFTAGFLVVGLASSVPTLLAGLALLALGFGGTLPSLVSLLSRSAPDAIQGGSLGIGQSAGALARVIGPFVSGVSWDFLGDSAPYFVAAGFGVVAGLWGFRLVRPE
ncbi:MAG: MFS transporter [Gammaproteobacteria bacterium]|nr:MFS transporter [Gammaproteobacteria bacterium]